MSLNKIVHPMLNQQLNIIVNSLETTGPLTTRCTDDGKVIDYTPPNIGNIGDILTRVGSTGNVAFLPAPSSGGIVTSPLSENLSIGLYNVIGLPSGQTLKGINELQVEQTPLIDSMVDKTQNFNASLTGFEYTVLNGVLRSTTGFASQQFGSTLFQSKINMSNDPDSTVNVVADNFQYNGNPVATVADIQTTTLTSLGTGDSIVFQDVGPSLSVKSFLSGDGISIFSSSTSLEISNTDHPKTQNQSAILNDTTFTGIVHADSFVKNGGSGIQYLMANGDTLTQSANSGNSNFYLYNSGTSRSPTPVSGYLTYNNVLQNISTMIYISHKTSDNIDIDIFFKQLSTLSDVYIQDREVSEFFIQFNISGPPVITTNAQVAIPVTVSSSGTTGFSDGRPILVSFFTNSLETDTRISAVENKTQNIALAGSTFTTFSGINGIYAQNFAKQGVGSTSDDIMLGNGSYSSLFALTNGIFNLQNKTQNQTADTVSTNFSGVGGIISNKFVKTGGGLTTEFLKSNGDFDATPYIPSTGLNTNLLLADGSTTGLSRITNLETKTTFQSIVSGNTSFSSGLVLNGPITTNGASNIDIMSMDKPYIGIQYIHNSAVIATQSNSLWTAAGSTTAVTAPYSTANNVTRQLCSANWSFPTPGDGQICGYGATITSGAQVCTGFPFGLIFVGNIADTGYNANNCQNVFGLWSSSTAPSLSQSVQLSARANHIVFGSNTTDPNICIYTAGAAAGSNKQVDLGSSFPANRPSANASTDWLKLCLWWDGSTTMYYKAVNETLNVTVTGSFVPTAGQIPIPTFTLYPQCCRVMGSPNSTGQARLIVKRFGVF